MKRKACTQLTGWGSCAAPPKRPWWAMAMLLVIGPLLLQPALAQEHDSDKDGLSDSVEQLLGYDPNFFDSNVDGISDFQDALRHNKVNSQGQILSLSGSSNSRTNINSNILMASPAASNIDAKSVAADTVFEDTDSDGDTIPNTLEAYGYYYDPLATVGDGIYGVKRKFLQQEWLEFKARTLQENGQTITPSPFELATFVLEQYGYVETVSIQAGSGNNSQLTTYSYVDFSSSAARQLIYDTFVEAYGASHALVTGNTTREGSISYILKKISQQPLQAPSTGQYYFTDPERKSSDFDPLSDLEEVKNVDANGLLTSPADHPLVAGYPVIKAELREYSIIRKAQLRDAEGGEAKTSWSSKLDVESSFSLGTTTTVKAGAELSGLKFTYSASVEHSISTTYSVSVNKSWENSGSNAKTWNLTTVTDTDCAAEIRFNYMLKNVGTAPAYQVIPRINFFVGDELIGTYTAQTPVGDLLAGAEQSDIGFPDLSEQGICLSADQLKSIETGGNIRTKLTIADASLPYMDKDGTHYEEGPWRGYVGTIEAASAQLQLRLPSTDHTHEDSDRIDRTYLVYAGNAMRLSLADALGLTMDRKLCPMGSSTDDICIGPFNKTYKVSDADTYVVMQGYDDTGVRLPADEINEHLVFKNGGSEVDKISDIPMIAKWHYSLVIPEYEEAQFLYNNVFLFEGDYVFLAAVTDEFGIASVGFCPNGVVDESECSEMTDLTGANAVPYSTNLRVYEYKVPAAAYQLTGNELFVATNTRGVDQLIMASEIYANAHSDMLKQINLAKQEFLTYQMNASEYDGIDNNIYLKAVSEGWIPDVRALAESVRLHLAKINAVLALCEGLQPDSPDIAKCVTDGFNELQMIKDEAIDIPELESVYQLMAVLSQPVNQLYLIL